jgi:phospholipase/carboxylesterase
LETEFEMRNSRQTKSAESAANKGKLLSRPTQQNNPALETGLRSLPSADEREVLLYVPTGYKPEMPAPLALMLHGAGGNAQHGISYLQNFADEFGIIILATKSLYATWDVIAANEYGADVKFIDSALRQVFDQFSVDYSRLAVGGFSDGASYALSLGIMNGELFSHIIAFSPGFMAPAAQIGKPHIYISHGTHDGVLPIERCSRRIVPQLEKAGYDVIYREFEGSYTIPPGINREAVEWFAQKTIK